MLFERVQLLFSHRNMYISSSFTVPASSPSRGGDATVYVKDIILPSLPTPFYSVLVSVSVFTALSTVFHSIKSSDNFPFSYPVLPVFFLPYWSFQLCVSLRKCPSALVEPLVVDWARDTNKQTHHLHLYCLTFMRHRRYYDCGCCGHT